MKYASITVLSLALLPSGVVIACASGSDTELFDGGGGGHSETSTTASSSSGAQCVPQCKTDQECQDSCAPAGAGSNCCDMSGMCFVSQTTTCPAPPMDAGSDGMPPY